MPSTAISATPSHVYVSTAAGTLKNITAISKAYPCVVTSSAHGFAVGTVVFLSAIGGMTELNQRAAVITAQDAGTFTLGGVDSTSYTTYTSGGTATPQTMTEVENPKTWGRAGNPAAEIEVTNLNSIAVERISGLPDRGSVTMGIDIDHTGPGQKAIRDSIGISAKAMKIVLSNGKQGAVMVAWNNFSDSLAVGTAHNGEFTGFVSTDYSWYA